MKNTILTFFVCFLGLTCVINCNAQNDPFGKSSTDDKEPTEISDFETYRTNPGNTQIASLLAKELDFILKANSKEPITIIDARSEEEYNVSHINKSRRVGFEDFSIERIWMVSRESRVIIYSTNKNRSTIVAQYLQLMGFKDLQVLEDGLIGWKNGGNDVYDANGTTKKIHVGSKANLKLVKNGLAVY